MKKSIDENRFLQVQVATPNGEKNVSLANGLFARLEAAVAEAACYRGKVLSLEGGGSYSGETVGVRVHRLREVTREQVILPAATVDLLERNVVKFIAARPGLGGLGMTTKKGLLFYGPPGTGKTHTIHHLAGSLPGHTTLIITSEQVGLLGEYMALARLLQPNLVVIEDADLIARDRAEANTCEEVLLNKLLNEMNGLRADADILFVLTTNRPEALEDALAARPGRIDQAVEFPLPDADGRAKLLRLYARGVELADDVLAGAVRRTESVSAAFIKESVRRAVQCSLERGGDGLSPADFDEALGEMLFAGGPLNLKLLGAEPSAAG